MSRHPNLDRAVHQLARHGSGTPNDPVSEMWTVAGFGKALQAAVTGPFWPLGKFPNAPRSEQEAS